MAKINGLDKLTYAELLDLHERVGVAMIEAKAAEKRAVREKMEALAAASGFSLTELIGGKKGSVKGSKIAPKYRNPKDSSQTWAGRGRQPLWLVATLKKGQKLESFLA